jgi:cell division protein FtsB
MQKKRRLAFTMLVSILIIVTLLSEQGRAGLDAVVRNAIVIAYMNGYADALELKPEEIDELKANRTLYRQKIEQAAEKYIITVENMNE